MKGSENKAEGIRWDLGDLYDGIEDPKIREELAAASRRALNFADTYRERVETKTMTGEDFGQALVEYEAIIESFQKPLFYASLCFAADTQDLQVQDLLQIAHERTTEIENQLVFFSLGLIALTDDSLAALLQTPNVAKYRHYLQVVRQSKAYTLSEKEEQLLKEKDLSGRQAFVKLYDQLAGSLTFPVTIAGESMVLNDSEMLALQRHVNGEVREHAQNVFLGTYAKHSLVFTSIFNNLLLDHKIESEQRGYEDATVPTHLSNEIARVTVDAMMDAVERHYPLVQRYFRLKARILGEERLKITDLYAPVRKVREVIPFKEAVNTIVTAFNDFSGEFGAIAETIFDGQWVDAEVRSGKRGGAFCAALSPAHHPYVLCSYNGTERDVATLAHELGHGVHYMLARKQRLLHYDAPLVLAETASVFAELLLIQYRLKRIEDADARKVLSCQVMEEMYGTVFRQTALTRFEIAAHKKRKMGQLSSDDLSELWLGEQEKMFGESVELLPVYRWGWIYIPHFIHSRFYCYSYPFGELLTLALFQRYLDQGEAFVPAYIQLLENGGSERPEVALAGIGIDINDPDFWDQGFKVMQGFFTDLDGIQ